MISRGVAREKSMESCQDGGERVGQLSWHEEKCGVVT